MVDKLISVDEEMNGGEYVDVFEMFTYPEAQQLNDTREKLYLKVLQGVSESLDRESPEFEIQQKAVHTIATEYIKNRKAGDILLEELRGYEEQMVALENELLQKINTIEQLERAREDDREIRDDMLGEIKHLEEMCEKYQSEIEALESDLMHTGTL